MLIRELFARDIDRRIEEVIKVDQTDEAILREELEEYVVTSSMRKSYLAILEEYAERPNKPSDAVGVWVSGFFGSGKSSFAKNLGLALSKRPVEGSDALELLSSRINDSKASALLRKVDEQIPTDAVILDVSTDRGVVGNQTLTEILYRSFLEHLGYSRDLDIAELEISLEEDGRLEAFLDAHQATYPEKDWDVQKNRPAFALGEASKVMRVLDPETYPEIDSWKNGARKRADVSPGHLAERCKELMQRRREGKTLAFVVDEVGQFVARDVQKMLDLQGIVQSLGRVGRGKMWLVVTSQEKLTELVGGLDGQQGELPRLMDRFPLQVHLEPSDIAEVTSRRVLAKSAAGADKLRGLFQREGARLAADTRVRANVQLPPLTPDSFAELYPLLPYQVNLIIDVVSGLRTQGGASRQVGGANRTIIKLAQQLLIHPDVRMGEEEIGALATLDRIYDLASGNIPTELRAKIQSIPDAVPHPLAAPVAKAVCLLQFVQNIPPTKENLAAVLHPGIGADSRLAEVEAALQALEAALKVRQGERGYRIPSPVEDDWEAQRSQIRARPGDESRIHQRALAELWTPQPSHVLLNARTFRAGLVFGGGSLQDGDLAIHVALADPDRFADEAERARQQSHTEKDAVFWVAQIDENLARDVAELHRSEEMVSRRSHGTQGQSEVTLAAEERRRRQRAQEEVRRRLREALLAGSVYFRGNDRSPSEGTRDLKSAVEQLLERVLPEVYDRFAEGGAKVKPRDLETLLEAANLRGLPAVFSDLQLVTTQGGQDAFNTDAGPLAEMLARIRNRADYGDPTSGRSLAEEFGREPYGWDFEVVRLMAASLLRAGTVEMRSQNQTIESARTLEARNVLTNNNRFRQATFRPRSGGPDSTELVDASAHFERIFGKSLRELEVGSMVSELRGEMGTIVDRLRLMSERLAREGLPGRESLVDAERLASEVLSVPDGRALSAFVTGHKTLEHGLDRLQALEEHLHDAALEQLRAARRGLELQWPSMNEDGAGDPDVHTAAEAITDILARETFYKELPGLSSAVAQIQRAYHDRHRERSSERREAYLAALRKLESTDGWSELDPETRDEITAPLRRRAEDAEPSEPLAMLRENTHACPGLLQNAVQRLLHHVTRGTDPTILVVTDFVRGPITSEEQLDAVLGELRDQCVRSLVDGNPVILS